MTAGPLAAAVIDGPSARTAPGDSRRYLHAINLVRWVTSIGVVGTHCLQQFGASRSVAFGVALSELHATREIFFLVSGLVMTYAYYQRRPFPWRRFYGRRLRWLFLPYLVWTAVYFGSSYTGFARFSRAGIRPGTLLDQAGQALYFVYYGVGHLYYLAVLLQFCAVFPIVLWVVRRTERFHLLILAASLGVQIWLMLGVTQTVATNREIFNYQLYLVAGCLAGARLEQLAGWSRRWQGPLVLLVAAVIAGTETYFVYSVHHGTPIGVGDDPFQVRFIALDLASFLGLYLAADWWQRAHHRSALLDRVVRGGADNSYAAYLSQGVFLDLLIAGGLVPRLERAEMGQAFAILAAVAVVWAAGAATGSVLARTPLAWSVGRARRRIAGSAPAGRFEPV